MTLKLKKTNLLVEPGLDGGIHFIDNEISTNSKRESVDYQGKIVIKSFVIGHHHVYSALVEILPSSQVRQSS